MKFSTKKPVMMLALGTPEALRYASMSALSSKCCTLVYFPPEICLTLGRELLRGRQIHRRVPSDSRGMAIR